MPHIAGGIFGFDEDGDLDTEVTMHRVQQ